MNKSLFIAFTYTTIWVILTITQIFILFYYFPSVNFLGQIILYDTLVCNILQAAVILILWYPIKYSRNLFNLPLSLLFHTLLFLISSAFWMGFGFLINNIILSYYQYYPEFFLSILPIRIIFSLFIYIAFVLSCYLLLSRNDLKEQKQRNEENLAPNSPVPVEKLTRIIVKKNSEFHCLTVNQIRYIEANGDYVMIYSDSNKFLKDQTMKYWETHLPEDNFVRIHRSFIVNIEAIAKIELYEKETYKVHLKNGDILKASSAGYKLLKQKMRL